MSVIGGEGGSLKQRKVYSPGAVKASARCHLNQVINSRDVMNRSFMIRSFLNEIFRKK